MIISASRRTDIPAYYSEWFFNRIREGIVHVRNPMNARQISKINLSPDVVDCIVFWSKNPKPMLDKLSFMKDYHYYFQFTLNSYSDDIETKLPPGSKIIETFLRLAEQIGPRRVIWRYDPILLNNKYTIAYHINRFGETARKLKGYTEKVIFSFIDFYKKIDNNIKYLNVRDITVDEKNTIAENLSNIAKNNGFQIDTCAEGIDLSKYGISHARCIDDRLISKITGYNLEAAKDKNQRLECGCIAGIDIGAYNSCQNGCLYCYANYSQNIVEKNALKHNPLSLLLIGEDDSNDIFNLPPRQSSIFLLS
ncbi:MAG: DUF1848 domain-containing protein [Spirochaetia bacterium]|jgi:hypothetical protein|nr:DUF1848 domain-containing protein [Spirochaetia bacterium]